MNYLPRVSSVDEWIIDETVKGFPGHIGPMPLREIGAQGWNVLREDVPLPVAVLKASAIAHNRQWMQRFLSYSGVVLCPHGKTTMSPQIFQAQLADGAWGLTCATISQLQVYRRFGIQRILIANQVISRRNIDYLIREMCEDEQFEPYVVVDSHIGVERLANAAQAAGLTRPLRVLLEVGSPGARTGVRTIAEMVALIRVIEAAGAALLIAGVEAFEDVMQSLGEKKEHAVLALIDFLIDTARLAAQSPAARSADPMILSAGGSANFDLIAARLSAASIGRETIVVLRSGCYITHDHLHYANAEQARLARAPALANLGPGLLAALEVWSVVQSRPEQGRAYLSAGKRDLSYDFDLPRAFAWYRPGVHATRQSIPPDHQVIALNDQHTHLRVPCDSPLLVGDLVGIGISHPCTTFDKWRLIYVIDDEYNIKDAVLTFF